MLSHSIIIASPQTKRLFYVNIFEANVYAMHVCCVKIDEWKVELDFMAIEVFGRIDKEKKKLP